MERGEWVTQNHDQNFMQRGNRYMNRSREELLDELEAAYRRIDELEQLTSLDEDTGNQTREALRESEDKYRLLVENANEAIFVLQDYKLKFVNPKTCEFSGYPKEELTSLPLEDIIHPEDWEMVADRIQRRINGDVSSEVYSFRAIDKGGNVRWVENHVVLISWEGMPATLNFLVDITGRKRAEEERKRLENQLVQSQKMEALGTLSGGIAHDFNNILTPIIGFAEIALDSCGENPELQEDLHEILLAGQRAKELVNQILSYSRQGMTEPKPVKARYLIKEALKLLGASIPKTITINANIRSRSMIMSDPTHIHQILINLCTNAAHAMRDNGGDLDVMLDDLVLDAESAASYPEAAPGKYVVLTVRDTGHGMTDEVREKIFNPYFTTKGTGVGTGLGLFVVHGIVKKHNGFIAVDSTPGKGSAFQVFFPMLEQEVKPSAVSDEYYPVGQESILVIDDEEPIAHYLKIALERLGYMVTIRTDSREALDLFKMNPQDFDLVIADLIMPGLTGDRLAKEMITVRNDIPIILSTGSNSKFTTEEELKMGIRGYIMKPILKKDLAGLIRNVFDSNEENIDKTLN